MKKITWILPLFIFLAEFIALAFWVGYQPSGNFKIFEPGMDNKPDNIESLSGKVNIGEFFESFTNDTETQKGFGNWSGFRGNKRDNISYEGIALLNDLQNKQIEEIWQINLGEGHAAPVVLNGKVYILDYDEIRKSDMLRCFSLLTGNEIWRRWYRVEIKRNHGISRTVPAVSEEYVVTIGPMCHVMCVKADSGELIWDIDLAEKYKTKVPLWYTGQCPIIENGAAIIAPAGSSLMIGIDCDTGEILWETPNNNNWNMSHASIMPMILDGKKMYVYPALGGTTGISAEGNDIGQILWETKEWNNSVIAPSPVIFDDGKIFLTAGYGAGNMMLKVLRENTNFSVEVLFENTPKEGLACEQQTPILFENHLFSILPEDSGGNRNQFVCYDSSGNSVWTSGKTNKFGLGPFLMADNKFFILDDDGTLTVIRASLEKYEELWTMKVMDGIDAWGPMVITEGLLLLRDSRKMICLDIRDE